MRNTRRLVPLLALLASATFAQPGSAAQLLNTTVASSKASQRACHAKLYAAGNGVVHRKVTVPRLGLVQARLAGRGRGDWDLGVFNSRGRAVAGSAHFRSRELAEGIVGSDQRLTVQSCRQRGSLRRVRLTVTNVALPQAKPGQKVFLARVLTPTRADKNRLLESGLDVTEHGRETYLDVVLYGRSDVARLEKDGFQFYYLSKDMFAATRAALAGRSTRARSHQGGGGFPTMPSGRTNYRRLADYGADLKLLAEQHPELVKPITLPYLTREGRPVEGVIVGKNPGANDGRPTFLQMGVHHAREWPSGEHAIEWAFELVNGYGKNDRTTRLMETTKTIVVPLVNPDGFNLTREMPFANSNLDPHAREIPVDSSQPVVDPGFAYKRKNCHIVGYNSTQSGYAAPANANCAQTSNRRLGVDPNRNYGGFWGGPGATHDPANDTFYGEDPFSEPETQNVRHLVANNQVTTLITNHTYSDLILRPPGIKAVGDAFDEEMYRGLGQTMADQNGYSNWKSFQLYDTTGTLEDWSYPATGGFGFTFEIGRAAQSKTNDVKSGEPNTQLGLDIAGSYASVGFHPNYRVGVVSEWFGKGPWFGKGNREAYYQALEAAADPAKHSVIAGRATPGSTLTLTKTIETRTSPRGTTASGLEVFSPSGTPLSFSDTLTSTMSVPSSGAFEWHVNPSTRPAVAKGVPGRPAIGPRTADQQIAHDPNAEFKPGLGLPSPMAPAPGTYEDRDFEILPTEDNGSLSVVVTWPGEGTTVTPSTPVMGGVSDEDLDLYLYRFNSQLGTWLEVTHSGASSGNREALTVPAPVAGKYRIRVVNYLAPNADDIDWSGSLTFTDPATAEGVPPAKEAWSLVCTAPDGTTTTTSVIVDRGGRAEPDMTGCGGKSKKPKPAKPPK